MLSGKKTYLAGIAAVLGAVAAALSGTLPWGEAIAIIVPAVLGMTVRSGVTAEVAKTAAKTAVGYPHHPLTESAVEGNPPKRGVTTSAIMLLVLAVFVLPGCQGLSSALGQTPTATAPVFNGIGITALPGAEVWIDGASPDNSGAVGASGTASQANEQRQVTQIDPGAVAKGIADIAEVVVPAGKAATMIAKAQEALDSGDVVKAETLRRAAKGLAEREAKKAEEEKKAEEAAPAPAPAPVTPPTE